MADRYCPSCGTEVDADARFCPTCGITLEDDAQPELPPAPGWPPAESREEAAAAARDEGPAETQAVPAPEPTAPPPPAPAPPIMGGGSASVPPPRQPAQPAPPSATPAGQGVELPFTWPTMASGWLIGIGSLVGAIALLPSLTNLLSVVLLLALLVLAVTVFLPDRIPTIPRLRLITLVVTTIGLGIALDRSAFTVRGIETLLLLAMLAAAGGALLIELDRDRPMPPPNSSEG
jgi:hypothetical protein